MLACHSDNRLPVTHFTARRGNPLRRAVLFSLPSVYRCIHVFMSKLCVAILLFCLACLPVPADPASAAIDEHLHRAAAYLASRDLDSAAKEFQIVLTLDPNSADAYANLGVIAFARHDYPISLRYLQRALTLDPSLTQTEALLGICEHRLGQSSAQSHLEKAFPLLKERNLRVQTGLDLANLDYQQSNLDSAASVMRTLVDLEPDNIDVLYMAQRVYAELADDTLNKIAIVAPGSARMQQIIAERLVNEGDLKDAIPHYNEALALNPRLPGVHFELAEAILDSGPTNSDNQAAAETELKAAVAADGDSAGVECIFARLAARRSNFDAELAHYKRALELNSSNTEARVGLGRSLARTEHFDAAAGDLRLAIQSDPLNEQAHYWLATVNKRLGLTSESQKEFKLFHQVKQAKERLVDLYRQMNLKPPSQQNDQE